MSTTATIRAAGALRLSFQPDNTKNPTRGTLEVTSTDPAYKGKTLFIDRLDIEKDSLRKRVVKTLTTDHPDVMPSEKEKEMLDCLMSLVADAKQVKPISNEPSESHPAEGDIADTPEYRAAFTMLTGDNLFEQLATDFEDLGISGEYVLALTLYLIMTSRLLKKPLIGIIQGASSSGKSYTIESVAELIPPQEKVMAHDFSERALDYMPPGALKHKVIICGERIHSTRGKEGQAQDNSKAFRELAASGIYRRDVVVDNKEGGRETRHIEQEGPIAYVESTTATYIPDEDSTRFIKLASDESLEQTRNIQSLQKRKAKEDTDGDDKKAEIIGKHHALQNLLKVNHSDKPPHILIPFIDYLSLPCHIVSTRRAFPFVISVIQAVALLRQYQDSKTRGGEKRIIIADKEDYRIAYQLLLPILERMYGSLPAKSKNLLGVIMGNTGKPIEGVVLGDGRKVRVSPSSSVIWNEFTVQDCQDWLGVSNSEAWRRLKPLTFAGIISCDEKKKPYKFKVVNPELADTVDILSEGLPIPDKMDKLIEQDNLRREQREGGTSEE